MRKFLLFVGAATIACLGIPTSNAQASCFDQYEGVHQFPLTNAMVIVHDHVRDVTDTVWMSGPTTVLATSIGDTNGNGRDELRTEMLEMQLAGVSSSFGTVKVSESPTRTTLGLVEEMTPGTCFPATSFFDVFIETESPIVAHNHVGVHMETTLWEIPPQEGQGYVGPTGEAELFAGASHPEEVTQPEFLVAHIEHAKHYPTPPPPAPCEREIPPSGPAGPASGVSLTVQSVPLVAAPLVLLGRRGTTMTRSTRIGLFVLGLGALGMGLADVAQAHPREYFAASDCDASGTLTPNRTMVNACPPDEIDAVRGERQVGAVILCAGELVPNLLGQADLTINDDINNPSRARYCQDLNADGWCGGNPASSSPYGLDPNGARGEPYFAFCGSATLQSPLSLGDKLPQEWADPVTFGGNWDPAADVYVLLTSPAGNATYSVCSFLSDPTHGFVLH